MPVLVEDWILFIFFCVSVVLYVLILIALLLNRKNELLNGPFFLMTFSLGLSQIIATVNNWLLVKPRMMGLFYNFYSDLDPFASRLGNYINWFMPDCQTVLTTLITANRFTSIVWPIKSNKIWTKRTVRILIGFSWLLGFILSIPMIIYSDGNFEMVNGTMFLIYLYPAKMAQEYFLTTCLGLPVAILQVIAYAVMFFKASRMSKVQAKQPGRSKIFATQIKLAVTGFVVSINLLLVMVFTALASAGGQNFTVYYSLYKIVIDIYSESNPYLLLICSSPLRQELLILLGCAKKPAKRATTVMQKSMAENDQRKKSFALVRKQSINIATVDIKKNTPNTASSVPGHKSSRNSMISVHI